MSKLSKDAFAIMAICPEAKKTYGITVDKAGSNHFVFHWAFPIDKAKAHRKDMMRNMYVVVFQLTPNIQVAHIVGQRILYSVATVAV